MKVKTTDSRPEGRKDPPEFNQLLHSIPFMRYEHRILHRILNSVW